MEEYRVGKGDRAHQPWGRNTPGQQGGWLVGAQRQKGKIAGKDSRGQSCSWKDIANTHWEGKTFEATDLELVDFEMPVSHPGGSDTRAEGCIWSSGARAWLLLEIRTLSAHRCYLKSWDYPASPRQKEKDPDWPLGNITIRRPERREKPPYHS